MAVKTVPPFDIRNHCQECGIELCDLAEGVGLEEEVLLAYADGTLGLSAVHRLAIAAVLIDRSDALPDESAPWRMTSRLEQLRSHLDGTDYRAQQAERKKLVRDFRELCAEAREELEEEGERVS